MDTNVNVTPAIQSAEAVALHAAREALVKAAKGTGEVIKSYADALTVMFGAQWWLLKGKAKQPLKAERDAFAADMVAANPDFSKGTIDVYWQRVKEAAGYVTAGNRAKGDGTIDDKNLNDLRTIINRIFKSEEEGSDSPWSDEKAVLMDVFERMGGEVDKLG